MIGEKYIASSKTDTTKFLTSRRRLGVHDLAEDARVGRRASDSRYEELEGLRRLRVMLLSNN